MWNHFVHEYWILLKKALELYHGVQILWKAFLLSHDQKSHVFLLGLWFVYYLFDFWLNVKVFRRVQPDGFLTMEKDQEHYFQHLQMQGTLAFTRDSFLGQNCKQCPALVASQTMLRRVAPVELLLQEQTKETSRTVDAVIGWGRGMWEREAGEGQNGRGRLEGNGSSLRPPWQSWPDWWCALPRLGFALLPADVQWSELRTLVISPLLTRAGLAPLSLLLWTSVNLGY